MTVRTRVEPINRDVALILNQELSPTSRARQLAAFAAESIEEARQQNGRVLGRIPRSRTFVDGREGSPLTSVRPDGVIGTEFEVFGDLLVWIGEQLIKHSPIKSGRYAKSHTLLADGQEAAIGGIIPDADEYVFINTQPYARKIEKGSSSQAPDGVYQAIPLLPETKRRGNIAKVSFGYRVPLFGAVNSWAQTTRSGGHRRSDRAEWLRRQPAIIVRVSR